jgi:type IV pilus assembly protein PilE
MKSSKKQKGFTLIELLVVVLILGILAAIALPQYQLSVNKSKAATALQNVKLLKDLAELHLLSTGEWPRDINELPASVPESKYFTYSIGDNGIYAVYKSSAKSCFEYVRSDYGNGLTKVSNKFTCISFEGEWDKVCVALGGIFNDSGVNKYGNFKRYILK